MSLRARFTALLFGASAPVRDTRVPRVTSTVIDGRVSPERRAELTEAGRQWRDDVLARTRVERSGHFDAPRFSA